MKVIRIDSLEHQVPQIGLIADSAWRPDGKPLFLPDGTWNCELRVAVRIDRLGKFISRKFASRYYASFSIVNYLKAADDFAFFGLIDDTVVQGTWMPLPDEGTVDLTINTDTELSTVLKIDRAEIDNAVVRLSSDVTLKTGDILILPQTIHSYLPHTNMRICVLADGTSALDFSVK